MALSSAIFSAISTSRSKIPKLASAIPTVSSRCRAHHSSSAKTRSRSNFRTRESVADPQSQKVHPYGQPRLVSMMTAPIGPAGMNPRTGRSGSATGSCRGRRSDPGPRSARCRRPSGTTGPARRRARRDLVVRRRRGRERVQHGGEGRFPLAVDGDVDVGVRREPPLGVAGVLGCVRTAMHGHVARVARLDERRQTRGSGRSTRCSSRRGRCPDGPSATVSRRARPRTVGAGSRRIPRAGRLEKSLAAVMIMASDAGRPDQLGCTPTTLIRSTDGADASCSASIRSNSA